MENKTQAPELCVVIPVYNEAEIIGQVLDIWADKLDRLGVGYQIHVYNDGSKDGTLSVIQQTAGRHPRIVVHDKPNSGHGPTILAGYRQNVGAQWIFQTDSDNEIDHTHFAELWNKRHDYDLLLGTRTNRQTRTIRQCISLVSRLVVWIFYGRGVYDVNGPFRLMRCATYKALFFQIPDNTFAPNIILAGVAALYGWRIFETPVAFRFRQTGKVSIVGMKLLTNVVKAFKQVIAFRFQAHAPKR